MNTKNGFWAFVFGGLIGAAVALLYAPQPGEKTRRILLDNGQVVREKAMNSLHEAQARVGTFTEESKKRLEKLQKIGQHTFEEEKETLKAGFKQAKDAVTGDGNRDGSRETYS
ncbi:MAG TPA: YtxH domain-containing protein [Anaerolineales bacterium]|nr:YtxH domain-containing protein [Anaerolineales bacterium]